MFATVPVSLYTCSATNLLTALTAWVGGAGAWCSHAPLARRCIVYHGSAWIFLSLCYLVSWFKSRGHDTAPGPRSASWHWSP